MPAIPPPAISVAPDLGTEISGGSGLRECTDSRSSGSGKPDIHPQCFLAWILYQCFQTQPRGNRTVPQKQKAFALKGHFPDRGAQVQARMLPPALCRIRDAFRAAEPEYITESLISFLPVHEPAAKTPSVAVSRGPSLGWDSR